MSYDWNCKKCGRRVRATNEGRPSLIGHIPKVYREYRCIECGRIKEKVE